MEKDLFLDENDSLSNKPPVNEDILNLFTPGSENSPVSANNQQGQSTLNSNNVEVSNNKIYDLLGELQNLHIFKNLEKDDILEILKISQIKKYDEQQIIFNEGDEGERTLFVIIDGRVEIISESLQTKSKISIFAAGKGLTFGEMSFLDAQPRSATIRTIEPTEVFVINRKYFDLLIEQKPKVSAKFLMGLADILSRRLRATDQRLKYSI
jgi:CRP-like cAMP-binding protein